MGEARAAQVEARGAVHDEGGDRGLEALEALEPARSEVLAPDELEGRLPEVRVRDHGGRRDALAVLEHDAAGASPLDEDAAHLGAQQHFAAGGFDGPGELVREGLEGAPAIAGAVGDVGEQQGREVEEGGSGRREPEVGPERGEHRPGARVGDMLGEDAGEGRAAVTAQGREALESGGCGSSRRRSLAGELELGADPQALVHEAAQPSRRPREARRVGLDEGVEIAGGAQRELGVERGVHRVDRHERRAVPQAERAQQPRHEAPARRAGGSAAADQVHRRVEAVAAPPERVAVPADAVVTLEEQHALAGPRQQRGGGEAAEAAADHDHVVGVPARFAVEPCAGRTAGARRAQRTSSSRGSLAASP